MTSPLLLVLLLGAAQSTGTMSPTSDVSSNRVKATGATTSRMLRDWAQDIYGAAPVRAVPVVTQVRARGVLVAKSVALRAALKARDTYNGHEGVEPDGTGTYTYLWLRDYYHATKAFPGYFTHSALRNTVDSFVATIGGNVSGPTAPAERIQTNGTGVYRPGFEWGPLPAFDSAPYLALLVALTHHRGDSTVFSTHRSVIETALAGAPRDSSNRIYSDPASTLNGRATIGWGFEDSITGITGGLGMATALHAWAYRELEAVAIDAGNAEAARRLRDQADTLIAGLRTLRRSDGFYNAATNMQLPHVMLTSLIVAEGLCSVREQQESATALLTEYRRNTITQRGGIRHVVAPANFSVAGVNTYQNGGYWLGEWVDWLARSLHFAGDGAAARRLMQEAVDEVLREHRLDALAPWEWFYNDTRSTPRLYSAHAATFLSAVEDDETDEMRIRLGGALNSETTIPFPSGHSLIAMEVYAPAATTATVTVYAADQTAALADPINDPPLTYGTEMLVGTLALSSTQAGATRSGWTPLGIFGGYLRLKVTAGSATSDLVVRLTVGKSLPAWSTTIPLIDAFSSDTSAEYATTGVWTISGGRLRNANAGDAQAWLWNGLNTKDMQVQAVVRSADIGQRYPCLALRAVDADNMTFVLLGGGVIRVYDRVAGVDTPLGNTIPVTIANDTDYTLRASFVGSEVRVVFDGVEYTRASARTGAGKAGLRVGSSSGTAEIQFDDLSIRPVQPPPPGYLVEATPNHARVAGEPYPIDSSSTLRDHTGASIAPLPEGTGQFLTY